MSNKALKTIVYIEDDQDIAEVATMALQSIGKFKVIHFLSANEALENLKKLTPQLILLDMMMPEMDGMTFFEKILQQDELKNIPVIFMTAKIQNHEVENYLKKGAIGVISKPFDPMKLSELVNQYWSKKNHEKCAI